MRLKAEPNLLCFSVVFHFPVTFCQSNPTVCVFFFMVYDGVALFFAVDFPPSRPMYRV